jgi:hypothetical protein
MLNPPPEAVHRLPDRRDILRFVQPPADARGVGQGDVEDAVANDRGADDGRQRGDWSEKSPDRQQADEEDDLGLEGGDEFVEPGAAEALFRGDGTRSPFAPAKRPG